MFNFTNYLADKKRLIDSTLDSAIPANGEKPMIIHRAMRYAVMSGGKRLRPILCLASCEAVSGKAPSYAGHAAAAIELLHTYTLIHDDLPSMDNDDFRRGKPTIHRVFGEANAVLAGDALQALAFEIIASGTARHPVIGNLLVKELAEAAGSRGVVGGQVEDLDAAKHETSANMIRWIHLHKTAMLFRASVRMGAITGRASARQMDALSDFGVNFGMAFQIIDDILDSCQDRKERGQARKHKSGKQDNLSCVPVYGKEGATRRAQQHLSRACSVLCLFKDTRVRPLLAMADLLARRL
jgi:geranylgeranyl diphosphate synthase type II